MAARFENKVVLVTGAASGIGLGMVERFVAEGARVLAADIQDEKGASLAARFGDRVVYRRCDVTQTDEIAATVDAAVAVFGGLDVLCNNAGAGGTLLGVAEMDMAAWRATMDLLLTSVTAGVRYATPHMIARGGGAIVNTSSITALQAGYGPIAYSTAKAAVLHLTKLAAAELSAFRIRINAICPGLIATSIFGASLGMARPNADQMAALIAEKGAAMQPIGRAGAPTDIAAAAAFLASEEAGFITGAHLVVDGGITIGPRSAWDPETPSPFLAALGIDPVQAAAMRAAMLARPQE